MFRNGLQLLLELQVRKSRNATNSKKKEAYEVREVGVWFVFVSCFRGWGESESEGADEEVFQGDGGRRFGT